MSKKEYTPEQLDAINEFCQKRIGSLSKILINLSQQGEDISRFKDLINPNESLEINFELNSPGAKELFHQVYYNYEEFLGENLIRSLSKEEFGKLVDKRWYETKNSSTSDKNMIYVILNSGYFSIAEKILVEYFDDIIKNLNNKGVYYNNKIHDYFESITDDSRCIDLISEKQSEPLKNLYNLALNIGEKIALLREEMYLSKRKKKKKFSENEKLNAIGSSYYHFLKLAIAFKDDEFFKTILSKISKEDLDKVIYDSEATIVNNNFMKNKYHKYLYIRSETDFQNNILDIAVKHRASNILKYLENQVSINKSFITYFRDNKMEVGNFKEKVVFDLMFRIEECVRYSNSYSSRDEGKVLAENSNEVINFCNQFKDIHVSNKIIDYIKTKEFISNVMAIGSKALLSNMIKLIPEMKTEKILFKGENVSLQEVVFTYHLLNDFYNYCENKPTKDKFELFQKNSYLLKEEVNAEFLKKNKINLEKSFDLLKVMIAQYSLNNQEVNEYIKTMQDKFILDKSIDKTTKQIKFKI